MRLEKKATVVSTSVAALLMLMKMSIGILSGSIAVLASAIDSFLDLTVSLFNYFCKNYATDTTSGNLRPFCQKVGLFCKKKYGIIINSFEAAGI